MFNEKLFNDVKVVLFKNTIYEYDAPEVIAQLEGVIGSECFDIETTLSEVTYVFDGFVVEVDYENNKLIKLVIHDETQPGKIIKYGEVYTNE